MNYEEEKQVAIAAVTRAATLCEQVRRRRLADAIEKYDRSPVTIADFGAQAVICRTLAEAFPVDSIVAEESAALLRQSTMVEQLSQVTGAVQAIFSDATPDRVADWIDQGNSQPTSRYWVLDPIDGTKGFLRGDQYAIALALIENGEIKVGVMACPALPLSSTQVSAGAGVIFAAVRGQGAMMLSLDGQITQPIQVATAGMDNLCLIESVELDRGNPDLQRMVAQTVGLSYPPIKMDSLAKYGVIARGQAALYLRLPWVGSPDYRENSWDHAAGAIVVEEAGGRVTDMYGKPLDFSVGVKLINNRGIVASNGVLHDRVLKVLQDKVWE